MASSRNKSSAFSSGTTGTGMSVDKAKVQQEDDVPVYVPSR
jgi:hypothetical protein